MADSESPITKTLHERALVALYLYHERYFPEIHIEGTLKPGKREDDRGRWLRENQEARREALDKRVADWMWKKVKVWLKQGRINSMGFLKVTNKPRNLTAGMIVRAFPPNKIGSYPGLSIVEAREIIRCKKF